MVHDELSYWQRFDRNRLSRRRVLKGAGVGSVGLATAALVGCGDDDDDDDDGAPGVSPTTLSPGQGEQAKPGGTFTLHMGGSPRSLDPHFDTFPYCTAVVNCTNEGVLRFKPDLSEIEPELAQSLPENPDELTFSLSIKPGIKFQDIAPMNGRELTAEDVKYSIERQMTDEAGKFQHSYFFLGAVDNITTPDASTVLFKMKKAYAPMLSYLASPWTMIIGREVVEQYGDLTEHAIGTGPFIMKNWQKDVKFELEKNPNYREEGLPYVDKLEYLIAIDPDTTATMFTDRQVQAAVIGANQKDRVKGDRSDANYQAVPSQFWRQFRMSPTTPEAPYVAPFDQIRVREAIVSAIDAQQVLDLVYGGDGILTNGPILPIYEQWTLKDEVAPFDLDKAKRLMSEAGVNEYTGDMIWATSPEADQIGEILRQQLAEINVSLNLTPMELAAYYNQTYSYKYTFSHHVPLNNPDPDENLSSYFGRNGRFFKHHNPEIWDMIDAQASELDLEKRKQIVQDVQKLIVQDFPMKFMFTVNLHEFTDPAVKGWFYPVDLYDGRKTTAWLDA